MKAAEHKAAAEQCLDEINKLNEQMLTSYGPTLAAPAEIAQWYESTTRLTLGMAQVHAALATISDRVTFVADQTGTR